jgi:hypothetical protein
MKERASYSVFAEILGFAHGFRDLSCEQSFLAGKNAISPISVVSEIACLQQSNFTDCRSCAQESEPQLFIARLVLTGYLQNRRTINPT